MMRARRLMHISAPLYDGHLADVVLRIHPERFVHEAAENFARQDGGGPDRLPLLPHLVQTWHADPGVELVRVVRDVVEVMLEPGLTNELVDGAHGRQWIARQAFVGQ